MGDFLEITIIVCVFGPLWLFYLVYPGWVLENKKVSKPLEKADK